MPDFTVDDVPTQWLEDRAKRTVEALRDQGIDASWNLTVSPIDLLEEAAKALRKRLWQRPYGYELSAEERTVVLFLIGLYLGKLRAGRRVDFVAG